MFPRPILNAPFAAPFGAQAAPWTTLPQFLMSNTGTLLEDFESAAAWTVVTGNTPVNDTTNYKTGSQSLKLTTDAGQPTCRIDKTISFSPAGSPGDFRLNLYMDGASQSGNPGYTIYLGTSGAWTRYFSCANPMPLSSERAGWWSIPIPQSSWTATGGATWSDTFTRIRLLVSGATQVLSFDSLNYGVSATGAVMLTFDDAFANVYTNAFPLMEAHNVVGTVYMVSNYIGTGSYLSSAQLQTLDNAGWSICNHSKTHPNFTSLTQAQIETELDDCRDALDALGLTANSTHVGYPFGGHDADTLAAMAAQSMLSGRTINEHYFCLPLWEPYRIPSRLIQASTSVATAKGYVDNVNSLRSLVCLYMHEIVTGTPSGSQWSTARLEELIAYMVTLNVPNLTIDDIHDLGSGSKLVRQAI